MNIVMLDFTNSKRVLKVDSVNPISQLWIMNLIKYCTPDIYKQIILIFSRLGDSAQGTCRTGS